jgi:hypothetical protein
VTVILKKTEKVASVVATLPAGFNFEDFLLAFQTQHLKDWGKVVREYQKHERKTKTGKSHPMPEPTQYLRNALNVHQKSAVN